MSSQTGSALVLGASGQDGYYLISRLLSEGHEVHAVTGRPERVREFGLLPEQTENLRIHHNDLSRPDPVLDLIGQLKPEEIYNLAGQSSVFQSFREPLLTWQLNAHLVALILEALRNTSPRSRFYQASSTDMFGGGAGESLMFDENSPLRPQSPYAGAKAAAHMLCHTYRSAYGLRIACGILSNHESARRQENFLTRKIVDHVKAIAHLERDELDGYPPLVMGNLFVRRDWGFAPDYVEGMTLILRQIELKNSRSADNSCEDIGENYHDYVLGTGTSSAVWQLVDAAFRLRGFELDWELNSSDPARSKAFLTNPRTPAVVVSSEMMRPSDPLSIRIDPSKAEQQLGWRPRKGLDAFLRDMLH